MLAPQSNSHLFSPPRLVLSVTLIVLFAFLLARAQQPSSPGPESKEITPQAPAIWITAQNKDGTPTELSPSDLEVKVDGKQTAVSDLQRLSPPLDYCLLLDISGSTRPAVKTQYATAVALLSKVPQAGRDYGVLVDFNDEAYVDAEGTDPQKIIKGIHQDARGGTALYDTMVACSDDLAKRAPDALRLMFILSDGEDNSSHVNRETAERTLVKDRIRVFAIGQESGANSTSQSRARGNKDLKAFADLTGGKSYVPGKKLGLEQIVTDISGDLAGIYSMTLTSDKPLAGDRFLKLEVKCGRKDIAVTAPRQFFVPLP
jgi:Ca-activated chloride channel homolog